MSTYDDIIEQNKRSLTQAQIAALAQAAQQYSIENAGNRAGALASARQQYDTGYRGLQNMGLAGANGAQPTSGEVPRLKTEIQTPFDQYNQRLKSVERQRVAALSGNMVYQNQLAAEEARRRALAEEEARRQAAARETDQARFQRAQAVANAINRNRTFGKVTAADLSVPSRKEYEASTTPPEVQAFNQASVKAANAVTGVANTFPSVMVRAAAAMVGLQDPYSAINTAQQNEQLGAVKDAYQKADATLRGMDQTRKYGGTVDEKQYQATKRTRDEAKAVYDAEKSRREADTYRREAEKIQQQDPEYYDAIVTANNAKATPESRKSASRVIAARSVNDIVQGMGFTKTMTDKEYDDAKKVIPDVRMQLNIIDSTRKRQANGGTGGDDVIGEALAELKKMGYSEDSARELVKKFETDRNYNREYTYLIDAYTALQEHYGDKPEQGVNKNEKDYTYRMVNGLDTGTFTGTMGDALMSMWRDDKKIIGKDTTKYMTDEQRDAYNAIYEKDGIKAANEYIKDILPLIETQRAAEDQKWLEEMASKDRGGLSWLYANTQNPAWLLARATNLIGSIPAMAEKLAVNARNLAAGATGELKKYSPDSSISRISNWSDIIQAQQSKNILEHYESKNQPGIGKFVNFMYNTGTSMADSMIAMGVSGAMGSWATDALFFSSAGNQAYKDAIERGGTQEQAMGVAFASGLAEALFEHLSLEKLTQTLQFKGKTLTRAVKDMLTQAGVEGSEELFTELSNVLTDFAIMKDKSEMQQAINSGELGRFLWDRLSSATLGGLASGFLFGVAGFGGAVIDALADSETKNALGTRVRNNGDVQQVRDTAILIGGEAAQQAEKVQKRETNANVGEMTATVVQQVQEFGEKLDQDQQVAFARITDGAQMTAEEAADVYKLLGKEIVEEMNYDGTSAEAFQTSYNDRVQINKVVSKEEFRSKKEKQEAAERVWANPEQGLALTSEDGRTVRPMPGNMTAVAKAEQERTGFKTRTTATNGKVTYAISGMEARQGLSNEQIYQEIQNGLTKEARQKAQVYEKLANALGVSMVIHDVMTGTNGFIDEDGKMHVVLSGRQSVIRVAAHELTHYMQTHSNADYSSMRNHLVNEIGQEKFDQLVKKKAKQYGLDLNTEKGKQVADDEVCAELCERMLSSEEAIERFAEKDTAAAKTLKDHLLKILNAIREALKGAHFGKNSELIKSQETIEAWLTGLTNAINNAEARAQTNEGHIAQVAGVTSVDQEEMLDEIHEIEKAAEKEEIQVTEETKAEAKEETAQETKEESKKAKDQPGRLAVAAVRRQIELLKKTPGNEAKIADLEQKLANFEAKKQEKIDDTINRYCVDVTEYDMEGYARDLFNAGFSQDEVTVLFDTMTKAIEQVKLHRAILDFGPMLSEEAQNNPELAAKEIKEMKEGRAYLPYKQNADPHYKLALDFSTLCRKRILLQTIQERLQAKLGRALSQEETVAIRLELQNLQKNNKEEFGKIEVACALCYVEAARLKSPKVINAFLNNTKAEMQNYFAKKNPATKDIIEGKQQGWKVEHKYAPDATKKQMSSSDVTAFNTFSRELREQFESDSAAEQATVDRATRLTKGETVQIGGIKFPGRETFLSASWLEKLKGVEPDIFYAFTDKVRSATRSKAQETDTFYARRDIDMVTEGILGYANAESGFRHQSWSDFVTIHLLDTMASIIEMSTRQAKMHAYTKVPAMVRLLGKTGMMLNMSLIPAGQTGLKLDGTLDFDSVEGMAWETMIELRNAFPETAGNIAIGINDAQIRELLMSPDIDYVIPYHASGMNKNMRGYMDIKSWAEYTSSQNEKWNHRGNGKGKVPELSDWFDEKAAAEAEDGYAFMRAASEKYLQWCAKENLIPKFSQYLTNNGDGSYSLKEGYENYWKLLIDRKMMNQVTGKVILQQAVKPTFDQDTVLGLLEDRITDPTVQQQAKAADLVTEKFSGWTAGKNNASAEAIAAAKDMRDNAAKFAAQRRAAEGGVRNSLDIDDEYMDMAEDYTAGKATLEQTRALEQDVEKAARMAGYNSPKLYHGTASFGFTKFDLKKGGGLIFASSDRNTAGTYSGETEKTRIKDRYTGDVDSLRGENLIQTANKYLDNRYEGFELISDAQKQEYADRIRGIVDDTIKRGEEFVSDHNGAFDNKKMAVMDRILDSLLDIRSAETQTDLQHAYDQWDRSLCDLKFMDESICDEFMKQCKASIIGMVCQRYLRALLYSGDIYGYEDNGNLTFRYDNTIKAELDSELRRGVYSLYGKLGNNLEIDANGSYWDEITAPDELHMDGLQKTRDIAEKAFALGYDSITIKNLKDNGGQTGYQGAGDIYIFNAENAVKSADPVTYDDAGNIIPLSERFNTQEQDIRYDLDLDEDESPRSLAEQVIRYSLDETPKHRKAKATAKETGYKPAGKGPLARDVKVPEVAKNGKRVSDFTRSFLESNKATDEIASELLGKVESGEWGGYTRLTNDEAMERAKNYIAKRQVVAAQQDFHDMVMSGKYNVNTRALGLQLLTEAAQRGDKVALLDIASDLRVLATDAGQSVQIFSVLKDLGGVGSAWYLNKVVERLNAKYADQIADGKMNEISVPEELMTKLEQAQTTQDVTAAEKAIAKNIADQLPLTWADRLSNWRYMAMLANPTTHVRNMFGNLLMGGMNTAKDVVATGIERIGVKDQSKRTHAVITAKDRQAWNGFAEQSYKDNEGLLRGNGKFSFESEIKQNMRSFDTKALNAIAQFNFNKLEQEDMAFIRPAFKNALMQYMKAQGYTIQNGVAGKTVNGKFKAITKAQMAQAVEYASEQAWKATFHDASALASMLNKISNMNAASRLIVEGVLPFKKTPINIAKRGVEYSPAGIVMGTVQLMRDVKKGKVTTAHAIDNLASGITGTALMVVGMFLSKLGVIKAEGDDDKKKATYLQDTGDQTYSLKIGKYSFSLSALAPATIPLFMGAALQEKVSGTGDLDLSTVTDVISGALNPFMEMSFMSSLNSALKNYGNEGIGGALGNTVLTSAENYFSQYLPTVTSKLGQLADPTLRTTKSSATSPIGSGMDYYVRSLAKKVPGLEATLEPDVNVWGRQTKKDSFGKWALDFANKFILPTNVKVSNRDAVDDELIRLVESTGETGILPSDGPKYFTVNGEKYSMNAKQYTEYSQDRGIASYAAIKETMNSAAYQQASDAEKASMLTNALTAAQKQVNTVWKEKLGAFDKSAIKNTASAVKATAKGQTVSEVKDIQGDYSDPALYKVAAQYPDAYDKAAKAKSQGVDPDTFMDLYGYHESYIGKNRASDTRKAIMNSNLTAKQKELMDDLLVSDKGRNPDYSSQAWFDISMISQKHYDKAKTGEKLGIKPETYLAAYNRDKEIDAAKLGKDKKATVVKYVESLHLSAAAEDYLLANIFGYTTR